MSLIVVLCGLGGLACSLTWILEKRRLIKDTTADKIYVWTVIFFITGVLILGGVMLTQVPIAPFHHGF